VLTVLYLGGLRASELTATTTIERWWLEVTGKSTRPGWCRRPMS